MKNKQKTDLDIQANYIIKESKRLKKEAKELGLIE